MGATMNQRIMLCGLVGATLLALGSVAVARTWTDATGQFHVDGDFVSSKDGAVTINTSDGKTIQIQFEKLSRVDRDFIDGLKKPSPKTNPFVEVPKGPANAGVADPVVKTQEFVTDFLKRLSDQIDGVAALDTQEKKNAANDKMVKAFLAELKQKPLTFRFTIQDIVTSPDGLSSRLTLADPEGTDGFDSVINGMTLPIHKGDAAKISSGDKLVLTGKGTLTINSNPHGLGSYPVGMIGTRWSDVSQRQYEVGLSDLKFRTERKK
jgi:hypothetical protein